MLLNLFAIISPIYLSLRTGRHRFLWNLDIAELEHVDFRPEPIELRPNY